MLHARAPSGCPICDNCNRRRRRSPPTPSFHRLMPSYSGLPGNRPRFLDWTVAEEGKTLRVGAALLGHSRAFRIGSLSRQTRTGTENVSCPQMVPLGSLLYRSSRSRQTHCRPHAQHRLRKDEIITYLRGERTWVAVSGIKDSRTSTGKPSSRVPEILAPHCVRVSGRTEEPNGPRRCISGSRGR